MTIWGSTALNTQLRQAKAKLQQMLAENQDAKNRRAQCEQDAETDEELKQCKKINIPHSAISISNQEQQISNLEFEISKAEKREQEGREKEERMRPSGGSTTPEMWNKIKPDVLGSGISGDMSYQQMKETLRQQTINELRALSAGAGSVDPRSGRRTAQSSAAGSSRAKDLMSRLQNFDSWFDNMYASEMVPEMGPKPPVSSLPSGLQPRLPNYAGVPAGAAPTTQMPKPPISSVPNNYPGPTYGPATHTRRDFSNIAKNSGIPVSSVQLGMSDDEFSNWVKDEYKKKTGKPLLLL